MNIAKFSQKIYLSFNIASCNNSLNHFFFFSFFFSLIFPIIRSSSFPFLQQYSHKNNLHNRNTIATSSFRLAVPLQAVCRSAREGKRNSSRYLEKIQEMVQRSCATRTQRTEYVMFERSIGILHNVHGVLFVSYGS